jgi:hypothetical protein
MTTLLLEDAVRLARPRDAVRPVPPVRTLEALVTRAWTELTLRGGTACLACGGEMKTAPAASGEGGFSRCADCGAELS